MGEGWAEYAEQLADEMGLYSSDTARFGMLADITLSATLLVVDTGIHEFGWTRTQAIDYIREHTHVPLFARGGGGRSLSRLAGASLSYGLGRLEIRRPPRAGGAAAAREVRYPRLHDRVLENGACPLPLLRAMIERWIGRVALIVAVIVGAQHAAPLRLDAQRTPVLKQVDLPHAYYWARDVRPPGHQWPQLGDLVPDGSELIYSMQGRYGASVSAHRPRRS